MSKNLITKLINILLTVFIVFLISGCMEDKREIIMVATSLQDIVDDEYINSNNKDKFFINYGGSVSLSRRIHINENKIGAVILASNASINFLIEENIIEKKSVRTFAKNTLVIATKRKSKINDFDELIKEINFNDKSKFVVADPDIAPAGKYSHQALKQIFSEKFVDSKVISSGDVGYVSKLLASNEDFYGIVYITEAKRNNLKVLYNIPSEFHDDIEYKIGLLRNNDNIYITQFIDQLKSDRIETKISNLGFKVIE